MALVNRGALRSTIILIGLGIAMVIVLLLYANSVLRKGNSSSPNNLAPTSTQPTPPPVIDYKPN